MTEQVETTEERRTDQINLSPVAAAKVKSLLDQEGRDDLALRISVQPGGCSGLRYQLFFDERTLDGDVTTDFDGVTVVVDRMSVPYLNGAMIDFVDSIEKQGFTIDNPNATGFVRVRGLVPLSQALTTDEPPSVHRRGSHRLRRREPPSSTCPSEIVQSHRPFALVAPGFVAVESRTPPRPTGLDARGGRAARAVRRRRGAGSSPAVRLGLTRAWPRPTATTSSSGGRPRPSRVSLERPRRAVGQPSAPVAQGRA